MERNITREKCHHRHHRTYKNSLTLSYVFYETRINNGMKDTTDNTAYLNVTVELSRNTPFCEQNIT